VTPSLPAGLLGTPPGSAWPGPDTPHGDDPNPFVRFRHLLWAHHAALAAALTDSAYVDMVRRLDDAVAEVDGTGFRTTPLLPVSELAAAFGQRGGLWAKDETGNVSGTHKARHLFGLALHLEVQGVPAETPLAIASCGNAALGAAVIALAAGRPLAVHVPVWADPAVVDRLADLGADIRVCERREDEVGDPCVLRVRELVADGAVAFTCQGTDNLLTLDGGRTLGLELAEQLAEAGVDESQLVVQVGGGALASSCIQALADATDLDVLPARPRFHAVQTEGCAPLARAFALAVDSDDPFDDSHMWPWHDPSSLATGILDDVVYDWQPLVATMLEDETAPVVATEADIAEAHRLVHAHTDVPADPTGTAGVAGLLATRRDHTIDADEPAVVLLTGVER
tara:strand:- start:18730 stop:19920 length:1191 start_codon:yes stop_codon:yes gene_type:complete